MTDRPARFLGYGRQYIDDADIAAVTEALKGDYLTQGPEVARFEQALKTRFQAPFALACNSGTAALHLAAMAMDLKPGDAVIVPAMTFAATANAVRYTGADVVFADCDPDDGLMTVKHAQDAAGRVPKGKTLRAVFCVHMNGQCTDMEALYGWCRAENLYLLEDACHAIGTTYADGAPVGSCRHSDFAAFSFHPVKTIAMGEGGAVTTRHADMAKKMAMLVTHGITKNPDDFLHRDMAAAPWYHEMQSLGYNYRASDINCALARSQMDKLDFFCAERRRLMALYREFLAPLAPVLRMVEPSGFCDPVFHLNAVLIDFEQAGTTRADLMNDLKDAGIGTQVHYIPVYRHPYYRGLYPNHPVLPGAEHYYEQVLSLPLFVGMTDENVIYVSDKIGNFIKK